MLNLIEQRELFHIFFLRQLAARVRPVNYALKGGVNLRLFYGSVRYSEDMDIDVRDIEVFKLKDIVMDILSSKILQSGLRPFQIEKIVPPDMKSAKQTETTQRFKAHLITSAGDDLFTKIEFSRRKGTASARVEEIDSGILRHYKIAPLLVSHYPPEAALRQKVEALANRTETQARDIFDIYMLLPKAQPVNIPQATVEKAYNNLFNVDFGVFKDTVLQFLKKDDQRMFGKKNVWEDMQSRVAEAVQGMKMI